MGRSSVSGPRYGAAFFMPFTTGVLSGTDVIHIWKVPFACRVFHITARCVSTSGGTYSVASPGGDIIADRTIPTSVEDCHGSAGADVDIDAVASGVNRDLTEGESLTVTFNVGTNIVSGCIVVGLYPTAPPVEILEADE